MTRKPLLPRGVLACLGLALAISAQDRPERPEEPAHLDQPEHLRVLVWNVQRGANHFERGPEKVLTIVRETRPDVCLLQESYDLDGDRPTLGRWLAAELGWNAWQGESPHLCVLTRLEIRERWLHAAWHGVGARLVDDAGRELVVWTTWIDWRAYTPYALRDRPDIGDAELLACETEGSERAAQVRALLADLRERGHLDLEVPLLVGGDWNCPSHLDWTDDTARVFRFRRALPLPVSLAMAEQGFADAFRVVHPDPVQFPGITWTPLERGSATAPVPHDRIDRLYLRQPASVGDAPRLVPFTAAVLPRRWEPMAVPAAQRAFPSDHGAVVVDLAWR